jgi:hypothetical protein
MIEKNRKVYNVIKSNIKKYEKDNDIKLIFGDSLKCNEILRLKVQNDIKFNVVYIDPPYYSGIYEQSLEIASNLLPVGCKIACITFHALEDEIVKKTFQKYSKGEIQHFNRNDPRILASNSHLSSITLQVITKKPIIPTDEEIKKNVRSRSAKLRVAERI